MNDVESLNDFWKQEYYNCQNDDVILDLFQNIILNVGGISRFFWPLEKKIYYKNRGKNLRNVYQVSDSSILKNRDMRNYIEHFDEKLDDFLNEFDTWIVSQKYVGPITYVDDNRIFFRAYFYDKQVFKILNVEYEIKPILAEIRRIHEILLLQKENGGRF